MEEGRLWQGYIVFKVNVKLTGLNRLKSWDNSQGKPSFSKLRPTAVNLSLSCGVETILLDPIKVNLYCSSLILFSTKYFER